MVTLLAEVLMGVKITSQAIVFPPSLKIRKNSPPPSAPKMIYNLAFTVKECKK